MDVSGSQKWKRSTRYLCFHGAAPTPTFVECPDSECSEYLNWETRSHVGKAFPTETPTSTVDFGSILKI